jgi:hypothetical protein
MVKLSKSVRTMNLHPFIPFTYTDDHRLAELTFTTVDSMSDIQKWPGKGFVGSSFNTCCFRGVIWILNTKFKLSRFWQKYMLFFYSDGKTLHLPLIVRFFNCNYCSTESYRSLAIVIIASNYFGRKVASQTGNYITVRFPDLGFLWMAHWQFFSIRDGFRVICENVNLAATRHLRPEMTLLLDSLTPNLFHWSNDMFCQFIMIFV